MQNYKEIIDKVKPELDKVVNFLDRELAQIRTSRASPALVENIVVEYFEQKFPIKQLAAISSPQPRQITIQPWDKSYIEPIVNAISKSSLGASAVVDKDLVRINLPSLTEEYRKSLQKLLSEKSEQAKITIRHWREKVWKDVQDNFQAGKIREDDKFRAKDELQKLVDDYHKKIQDIKEKKEKEIME
jgi:ribosome recycling factor